MEIKNEAQLTKLSQALTDAVSCNHLPRAVSLCVSVSLSLCVSLRVSLRLSVYLCVPLFASIRSSFDQYLLSA